MKNVTIRIADWIDDKKDLESIRRRVFIDEQGVPELLEWDEDDSTATHFLALVDGKAVATVRLTTQGQIGRMAVLPEYRSQGIGSRLLGFVIETASSQNIKELFLHAQVSAIPFYARHGFTVYGDVFYEAYIAHREMRMKI